MDDVQQHITDTGILDRAVGLVSDEALVVLALTVLGMLIGMSFTGLCRLFLPNVDGDGPRAWADRGLLLHRLGAASSGLWTALIVGGYLVGELELGWFKGIVVAVGTGLLAGACNRPGFKVVRSSWRWALGKLRRKIEADHGPGSASDLDDTNFNPKP